MEVPDPTERRTRCRWGFCPHPPRPRSTWNHQSQSLHGNQKPSGARPPLDHTGRCEARSRDLHVGAARVADPRSATISLERLSARRRLLRATSSAPALTRVRLRRCLPAEQTAAQLCEVALVPAQPLDPVGGAPRASPSRANGRLAAVALSVRFRPRSLRARGAPPARAAAAWLREALVPAPQASTEGRAGPFAGEIPDTRGLEELGALSRCVPRPAWSWPVSGAQVPRGSGRSPQRAPSTARPRGGDDAVVRIVSMVFFAEPPRGHPLRATDLPAALASTRSLCRTAKAHGASFRSTSVHAAADGVMLTLLRSSRPLDLERCRCLRGRCTSAPRSRLIGLPADRNDPPGPSTGGATTSVLRFTWNVVSAVPGEASFLSGGASRGPPGARRAGRACSSGGAAVSGWVPPTGPRRDLTHSPGPAEGFGSAEHPFVAADRTTG
jgi:hypothetical protein